ncbi:MAG: 30S ribosomal protein S12 methylthiotransferase RimO [Parachlamydiales bacterium]|nr:30S ribosomal protein S12 methylthiotransferase RimO [Parachlamydiales bacterium]
MEKLFVCITSLGCVRNLVDTEVMLGYLINKGYRITTQIEQADIHIVNTCGFLQEAREEALAKIEEIFSYKKRKAQVIVTGCMIPLHQDLLRQRFPKIHFYLGAGNIDKIIEAMSVKTSGSMMTSKSFLENEHTPRYRSTPPHYAYLKISEGCKKRCSYCLIPSIKGPLKSKSLEQILCEVKTLLKEGVFEIILIAQDLGDYGKDFLKKDALSFLLKEILKIKKDFWIRLLYLYPDEISSELMEVIRSDPRICPYLDIPLQHVSDDILRLMQRKTSKDKMEKLLDTLRDKIPELILRTTFIVGFPGETETHFSELLDFVQQYRFDHVGVFAFSRERGTKAYSLPHQVQEEIAQERKKLLMETQRNIVLHKNRCFIGKSLEVIVDGYYPQSNHLLLEGRFYGQCPEVDGVVILNDVQQALHVGEKIQVQITDICEYDLIGKQTR